MKITHTVSTLELTWTVCAIIGLVFVLLLLWRSFKEKVWIEKEHANGYHEMRRYSAISSLLIFIGGTITQTSYLIVGIIAMTQPSPGGHPKLPQITSSAIFITASVSGTIFAAIIYRRRVKIVKMIAESLDKERSNG